MTVETHWWGIEVTFTKEEKEKIIHAGDLATPAVGALALREGVLAEAAAAAGLAVEAPIMAVIAFLLGLIIAELTACNLLGKGGFRICITWLVITLPPPLGSLTTQPLPVF